MLLEFVRATRFWFRLGGSRVKTVLVLEDNVSILALFRMVVEREGYTVLAATSAQQAFERFEENDAQVDLLLTDVTLPEGSGIRVALELQSLIPCLKIIIMSGFPSTMWRDEDAAAIDELPSDSVITLQKPFVPGTLLDSIHTLIGLPFIAVPALQVKVAG